MNSIFAAQYPACRRINLFDGEFFCFCTEPVSLMAMVPVTECKMPTFTVLSVTARPVVFTSAVLVPANWPHTAGTA